MHPHSQTHKKGAPTMIIQNLEPSNVLCNNIRLTYLNFMCNRIYVKVLGQFFSMFEFFNDYKHDAKLNFVKCLRIFV